MKKNLTELVFILDRSGSMSGLEADTIGGFNAMIEKQKKEEEGEALISTVLFDNDMQVIHDRVPLDSVPALTEKEYSVRAAPLCWTRWAEPSTTLATSTSTPVRRTGRRRPCSSSPPTAWKTPAAAIPMTRSGP